MNKSYGMQAKFVFIDDIVGTDGKTKGFMLTKEMEELLQKRYADSKFEQICETMVLKESDMKIVAKK